MRSLRLAAVAASMAVTGAASAATLFSDTFTGSGSTIGNSWAEAHSGTNVGDAQYNTNRLEIISNNGNDNGLTYVTQAMSNFTAISPPFNPKLSSNTHTIHWSFNMQSSNADLSGLDSGENAIGFVIAADSSNLTTANGYAVLMGTTGSTTDPVRLVRFAGGLGADANVTTLITGTGDGADPGANLLSVQVSYTPGTNTFELFVRNDGAGFADPSAGSYVSSGTAVNNTYTSSTMTTIGAFGRYDGNNQSRLFDNVKVEALPEPASLGFIGMGAMALAARRRRA
jgi:hypothetical protein